jgi:hypothetical protein
VLAHRAMYEAFVGTIAQGMFLCHKCDVPACVRPDHLFQVERHHYQPYDTDWSAAGPLIERYQMVVTPNGGGDGESAWAAHMHETKWRYWTGFGATPLIAICNLILALSAAGKLHT